jgi:hypothetical protein
MNVDSQLNVHKIYKLKDTMAMVMMVIGMAVLSFNRLLVSIADSQRI